MHVVLRIPKGSHRSDYRVALPSGVLFIGDGSDGSSVSFFEHSSDATYAYCMVSVYVAGVGVGTTLTAQHHGTGAHTKYVGDLDTEKVKAALGDDLSAEDPRIPSLATGEAGDILVLNKDKDGFELADEETDISKLLYDKTLDPEVIETPAWVTATEGDILFVNSCLLYTSPSPRDS